MSSLSQTGSKTISDTGFLNLDSERDFDAITSLAAHLFDVPLALISILDDENHRLFVESQIELGDARTGGRASLLPRFFCQYVKEFGKPLIVQDATDHELVKSSLVVPDINVMSFLGAPVFCSDNTPVGALCVIDSVVRDWTEGDVELLSRLARCVSNEFRHKSSNLECEKLYRDLHKKFSDTVRYNGLREWICGAFMAPNLSVLERFNSILKTGCEALCMEQGYITKTYGERVDVLYGHNLPTDIRLENKRISGTFSSLLMSGRSQHHFHDESTKQGDRRRDLLDRSPSSFIGVPIISNGVVFGTLELTSPHERLQEWSESELSMVSVMSMISGVYLGFIDKIQTMERSETALLQHIMERQGNSRVAAN